MIPPTLVGELLELMAAGGGRVSFLLEYGLSWVSHGSVESLMSMHIQAVLLFDLKLILVGYLEKDNMKTWV